RHSCRTVSPPTPESKTPTGRESTKAILGGLSGTSLVVGARWPFRDKDAGSPCSGQLQGRLRTRSRGGQRGPRAQTRFRQALLGTEAGCAHTHHLLAETRSSYGR